MFADDMHNVLVFIFQGADGKMGLDVQYWGKCLGMMNKKNQK